MDVYRPLLGQIPYVASTHNVEADVLLEAARLSRGLDRRVNERDARLLLRREAAHLAKAAAAVAVSAEDAARIAAIAPSARVSVVENGVDTEALRPLPPPPPDGPLLFVASFDYPVNVQAADHLARTIMPAIRARLGPTKLLLAGRRPPPTVHALAALGDTEVLDGVADLAPVYARARAVVVPILVGGGSRLKILEALALGRPVVTTTAGMRGLAVRDGVHVLVADTPEAFGDAIARLGSEAGLARQLTAAGRSFVETRHSWPALQSAFLDVVDRAARRASP
jgi:glycosyltransferase involved in cell wall biosynthesis